MAPKRTTRKAPPAAADQAPSPADDEVTGNAEEVVHDGGCDEEAAPKRPSKKPRAAASKSVKKAKAGKPLVKKAENPPPKKGKKVAVEDENGIDKDEAEKEENEEVDEEEVVDEQKVIQQKKSVQQTSLIIIEASKECNVFKTRAAKVQEDLKKALSGVEVLVNPDKPRRGCFEIRSNDGEVFISLQNMPRPFKKLRDVDLDNLVGEIVAQVKK